MYVGPDLLVTAIKVPTKYVWGTLADWSSGSSNNRRYIFFCSFPFETRICFFLLLFSYSDEMSPREVFGMYLYDIYAMEDIKGSESVPA